MHVHTVNPNSFHFLFFHFPIFSSKLSLLNLHHCNLYPLDKMLLQRLATALLGFINSQLQPAVLRVSLHTLRILSRDRQALGPLVTDSALFTLAHLGGISSPQACPQQGEEKAEDQSSRTHSQIHRRAVSGCEEGAEANGPPLSVSSVPSIPTPVEVAGASTPNDSVHHCYKWRGAGDQVVLARGKKDPWEDEEEEKEEDEEVCRKEALKVLCNIIYNSPRAQERASALR